MESLPPPSPPSRIPAAPLTSGPAGRRAGPQAISLDRNAGDGRPRSGPGGLPSSALPSCIPTAAIASNPHPCRPLTSGQRASGHAGGATGDPRSTGRQATRRPRPPWRASTIHAANSHPYRRHRYQAASLPPLTSGPADRRAGPPAIPLDRNTGDERRLALLAGCLHLRCQAESLPPPSPPSCIPAAPSRAGQRARPQAIPARPEGRRRASGPAHRSPGLRTSRACGMRSPARPGPANQIRRQSTSLPVLQRPCGWRFCLTGTYNQPGRPSPHPCPREGTEAF